MKTLYQVLPSEYFASLSDDKSLPSGMALYSKSLVDMQTESGLANGQELVVVEVDVEVIGAAMDPDLRSIERPDMPVVRRLHSEENLDNVSVWKRWSESGRTWEASVELVGTAICRRDIPLANLHVVARHQQGQGAALHA
ncbi:hypothetical protein HNP46_000359 [Pseudomonas nitritireducens]|uniref:Uncharacterized protein n=1 Tax=Pseudomonas nitroreducens TaxID=46680 RepID=A0A7W7NYC4_PSENT|nr:hypothetical protein [Pseudomonas nitritireducens]MBB4861548.1 hypothetical protein [Pseudomonas nitritireducens]